MTKLSTKSRFSSILGNLKSVSVMYKSGFPLDLRVHLENLENESAPGKPGNIMEF